MQQGEGFGRSTSTFCFNSPALVALRQDPRLLLQCMGTSLGCRWYKGTVTTLLRNTRRSGSAWQCSLRACLPGFSVSWVNQCAVQRISMLFSSSSPFDSTQYRQPFISLLSWMPSWQVLCLGNVLWSDMNLQPFWVGLKWCLRLCLNIIGPSVASGGTTGICHWRASDAWWSRDTNWWSNFTVDGYAWLHLTFIFHCYDLGGFVCFSFLDPQMAIIFSLFKNWWKHILFFTCFEGNPSTTVLQ